VKPIHRALLAGILVVSLALSVLFAVRVPFGDNPDEVAHRDYIRLLVANRGFVRFTPPAVSAADQAAAAPAGPPSPDDPTTPWETHQPPLYYLLCVPIQLAASGSVVAVRLVAAVLQLATILVCWFAMRDLFPEREELAIGTAAFVAFLPLQAQLSGAINNDALTTLVCAALFWRIGRLASRGQTVRDAVILGALFGTGLLTKSTVLELTPAMAVAYGIAVRARQMALRDAAKLFAITIGIGLLIASPWLARNQLLYGDPLALSIYTKTGPNFTPAQIMGGAGWDIGDYLRNVGVRSFATFWYTLPPTLSFRHFTGSPTLLLVVLVLGLGGAFGAYRWASRESSEEASAQRRSIGAFALGAALLVPFFVQFVLTVFQAQGRYFLPALLPIATITVLGWFSLVGGTRRPMVGPALVAAVLLALSAYALVQLG
jgi:4-amino-4-deoxy-L-arabinose transferase-like glycosyltransferase